MFDGYCASSDPSCFCSRKPAKMATRTFFIRRLSFTYLRRAGSGGAALEFAVILPVLVLLAIGVADFGRMFFTGITVASAARAGSQWGAHDVDNTNDTVSMRQKAEADAQNILPITVAARRFCKCPDGSDPACTDSCPDGYGQPQVFITVTVTKKLPLIFRYPGFPDTLTFKDSATFRAQ